MKNFIVVIILLCLGITSHVHANGLDGERMEKLVSPYIIDIGSDVVATSKNGEPIRPEPKVPIVFDFNLLKSDTRDYVTYDHVAVLITKDSGGVIIYKDIPMPKWGFNYLPVTFSDAGNYTFKVNFFKDGKDTADAVFPIKIGNSVPSIKSELIYALALIFLFLIVFFGFRFIRKHKRKNSISNENQP